MPDIPRFGEIPTPLSATSVLLDIRSQLETLNATSAKILRILEFLEPLLAAKKE